MAFRITTNSFMPGGSIPVNFTREGANTAPILRWEDAPEGTQSFALVMEDPDAPGETFCHWLLYDIPKDTLKIDPDHSHHEELPDGSKHGTNDADERGYTGPFPPAGKRHQYVFRLYALSAPAGGLEAGLKKDQLLKILDQRGILARAEITAFYKSLKKSRKAVA